MPNDVVGARFQPAVQLNHDFGHSPVGSLGGRTVQQVPSGGPRGQQVQGSGGFVDGLKRLGERILNAITPDGVRAQSKFRLGLENTSKQVGELLGALSKTGSHKVDGAGAQAIIDGLRGTMQPMTSRGANYDEVFSARVETNVKSMSLEQLVALKDGVALAKNSALSTDPHIAVIDKAVEAEVTKRLMDAAPGKIGPAFRQALEETTRGEHTQQAVQFSYEQMMFRAGDLLRSHGMPDNDDARRALVKDTLTKMLNAGDIKPEGVKAVFANIRSEDQLALQKSEPTGRAVSIQPHLNLGPILRDVIKERAENAEAGFKDGVEALLEGHQGAIEDDPKGPMHDPRGFAKEVIHLAGQYDVLTHHSEVHKLLVLPEIDTQKAEAVKKLELLLAEGNLTVTELSDEELHKLNMSLARLGVAHGREEIQAEMKKRKEQLQTAYTAELRKACTCARQGDMAGMLRALEGAQAKGGDMLLRFQKLDGKVIKEADKVLRFREDIMKAALKDLPTDDLKALWTATGTTEMNKLLGAMGEVAMPSMSTHPELGRRIMAAAMDLELMDNVLEDLLKARGEPPAAREANEESVGTMSVGVRGALREVYGIEVDKDANINVKVGLGSAQVQQLMEEHILSLRDEDVDDLVLEGGERQPIDPQMWKDFSRASYYYTTEEGESGPMLDREAWGKASPQQKEAMQVAGLDKLREVCGGDEQLMKAASKYMSQTVMAGLEKAMMSEDSPLRLPDGTPGRMVGQGHVSFHVGTDGDGGVVIRATYEVENCTHFMKMPGGEMVELIPDKDSNTARFTFEVSVGKDGAPQMTGPVQVSYDMKPWPHAYPRPSTVGEALGNPLARAAFREFVAGEFSTENLDFYEALETFNANPTLLGARAIVDEYIRTDSPKQVNISAQTRAAIIAALTSAGSDNLTPQQMKDAFAPGGDEILKLMKNDSFRRFLAAKDKA